MSHKIVCALVFAALFLSLLAPASAITVSELVASDGAAGDNFGWSVAIIGNVAVVGAPFANVGSNVSQGIVYVFVKSGASWSQVATLTASDGVAYQQFGGAVAIGRNTIVVGGRNSSDNLVYVFVEPNGGWTDMTQTAELSGVEGGLGSSVAISTDGKTIVAGAPNWDGASGGAFVYYEPTAGWANT